MKRKLLIVLCMVILIGCGPFSQETKMIKDYAWLSLETTGDNELIRNDKNGEYRETIISAYVFDVGWNNDFIIAKRKPSKEDVDNIEWYIVRVADDKLFGPFDEVRFNEMKKELNVPESIKFKINAEENK